MQPLFAEFEVDAIGGKRWQVCMADCHDYLTYDALADILYTEHLRILEQSDLLIVRTRVDRPLDPKSISPAEVQRIRKRAPHASLYLLFSNDYDIMLSRNLNEDVEDRITAEGQRRFLEWLQDKELYTFVKQSRALFKSRPQYVYRAPSKRYVNLFLRVGNVQTNRHVLDAFFFWMLPHLKDRNAILTDTWSIGSIALNAGRLLERYRAASREDGSGPPEDSDPEFLVEMLSSYPDDLLPVIPEAQELLRRASSDGNRNVLVLISAVATGTSLQRLRQTVARAQVREGEFKFLALYKLERELEIPCLCDVSSGIGDMKFTPVPRSQIRNRAVIEIDRGAYFPLEVIESPLLIAKRHCTPAKEFFTAYRGFNAVTLHRHAVDLNKQQLRHHAVYIDVEQMLRSRRFKRRLRRAVAQLSERLLLIVTPPHTQGQMLCEALNQVLQEMGRDTVRVFVHPDLRGIESSWVELIAFAREGDEVLIVDDVSITGQRLSRYQQSLRELRFAGRITYLVGVARPDSEKAWDRRVRELQYRSDFDEQHRVIFLEKVILPDWDQKSCPWCLESRALASLVRQARLTTTARRELTRRVMALQSAPWELGLINNALWSPLADSKLDLTPNSLFIDARKGPATDSEVLAAVSSGIQQMRIATGERAKLDAAYPHVSVLNTENYFGTHFNDDILRLAILRVARSSELEHWDDKAEEQRRTLTEHFLTEHENREIWTLELAVARLLNKVPQPDLSDDTAKTEGWPGELWEGLSQYEPS